jgi:hypothetical protein
VAEVVGTHTIDKHLTDVERTLQLKETKADISYFKRSYERADLHVTITSLGSEASAAAIDARLGSTSRRANAPTALGSLRWCLCHPCPAVGRPAKDPGARQGRRCRR